MIPVACYRLASSNLTVIAGYFPLPGQIKQPQTDSSILGGISLPLPVRIMAYPLTWLTLITIATGMYLIFLPAILKVFSVSSLLLSQTLLWPGKNSFPSLRSAHRSVRQNSKGLTGVSELQAAWI